MNINLVRPLTRNYSKKKIYIKKLKKKKERSKLKKLKKLKEMKRKQKNFVHKSKLFKNKKNKIVQRELNK